MQRTLQVSCKAGTDGCSHEEEENRTAVKGRFLERMKKLPSTIVDGSVMIERMSLWEKS
ncbi:hypothetical protein [Candidatus Soleaferrea massiliensis]|uniref:hypothetical protein n=1 Tax=Candidatus Soleaferrea massiliensis TaxID=1470354 RepID=UPI0018CD43E1|nr:hypothetical protein [Candidatus Soleaferrea massiliensis]